VAQSIRTVQQATFSVVVVMALLLAGFFAWAAVRLDALEIDLSNERLMARDIAQMVDRLDVILTAADLTLNGGETYTAQWAASRARELKQSIVEFAGAHPTVKLASAAPNVADNLDALASLIDSDNNRVGNQQTSADLLAQYDALAITVIEVLEEARLSAESRVELGESRREQNIQTLTLSLIAAVLLFLVSCLIASRFTTRLIVKPLEALSAATQEQRDIGADTDLMQGAPTEIQRVTDSMAGFVDTLSTRVKERTQQLETAGEELRAENLRRRKVEADLQVALEEARSASAAKSAFLSVMSHELRTPMNAVMGALHLIKGEPLSETQRELVLTARDAGDFLVGLLTDVLDISTIESDGVEIERRPTDLKQFLENFRRQMSVQMDAADCSCILVIDETAPDWVLIDQHRVQQILTNYVGNACKFAAGGALTLSVTAIPHEDRPGLKFALEDQGPGISPENQTQIFEPFSQVESNLNREAGGVGLGLSICRRLAEAMGGEANVDSQIGEGSTFWFEIPVEATEAPVAKRQSDNTKASDFTSRADSVSTELTILLVEDSEVNQMIARTMLEKRGLKVSIAASGLEAIEQASTTPFDIILMDLQMPGMDGLEATSQIKASIGPNVDTPVLAMTANVGAEFKIRTENVGMVGFIAKPLKPDAMMDSIFQALRDHQGA
jgi:signal transduction histidine kinase/ActR/RegA family two-component response regulator